MLLEKVQIYWRWFCFPADKCFPYKFSLVHGKIIRENSHRYKNVTVTYHRYKEVVPCHFLQWILRDLRKKVSPLRNSHQVCVIHKLASERQDSLVTWVRVYVEPVVWCCSVEHFFNKSINILWCTCPHSCSSTQRINVQQLWIFFIIAKKRYLDKMYRKKTYLCSNFFSYRDIFNLQ